MKIEHILVATDLSSMAPAVYRHAAAMARGFGARVTLLNVDELAGAGQALSELAGFLTQVETRRDARIREAREHFRGHGVSVDFVVVRGPAKAEILRWAHGHEVDLIVMGRRSRRMLEGLLMGSAVPHVVRHAEVPVLVVPVAVGEVAALELPAYEHVMVTTDLGDTSRRGLVATLELAATFEAGVTLIHALELPSFVPSFVDDDPVQLPQVTTEALKQDMKLRLTELLQDVGADRVVPIVVTHASPAVALVEAADTTQADLIVIPATGKGALQRALLGSTTERVLKRAPVPVLVWPASYLQARAAADPPGAS